MAAVHAMAKADGVHAAVLVGGPGVHRVGVGVVQEEDVGLGHLADILAEGQDLGDVALAIHDAARAQRIAHALVHAVLQRDVDVELEGFQPADAGRVDHVVRALDRGAAVQGRHEPGRQVVGLDVALHQAGHQVQVLLVDVHQRQLGAGQLRDRQQVLEQLS